MMANSHQKLGFSIIEMVIGMMISSILMTAALTIYNQISRGGLIVQKMTHLDTQALILKKRLDCDLQGLCPLWFSPEIYARIAELKKIPDKLEPKAKDSSPQTPAPAQPATPPLHNYQKNGLFFATASNDQLELFTFITTNALRSYDDAPSNLVRVVYQLIADPVHPNLFKLMRKEDTQISWDVTVEKLKAGTFYTIADHISSCVVEYGFVEKSPDTQSKSPDAQAKSTTPQPAPTPQSAPTKQSFELKYVKTWGAPSQMKQDVQATANLPDVIRITLTTKYYATQPEQTYQIICPITIGKQAPAKSFAEKRYEQNKKSSSANNQTQAKSDAKDTANNPSAKSGSNITQHIPKGLTNHQPSITFSPRIT